MAPPRSFSAELLELGRPIWDATAGHPVVRALSAGSLDRDRFHLWLQQDYLYARGSRRFLGLLIAQAPDDIGDRLARGAAALTAELERFRDYAAREGVPLNVSPLPTCRAYVDFLVATAVEGFAPGLTALYGEEKAYLDVWTGIRHTSGPGNPYAPWIEQWSSPGFAHYVDEIASDLDRQAATWSAPVRERAQEVFLTTARYEYLFWDMIERGERWPV